MAILIGLKNIFNILLNITLHIFTPAIETPLFIITASAPLPTLLDLTLSTSLLFALSYSLLRRSQRIEILQLHNMHLAMERDQLIKDLERTLAIGEQQMRQFRGLEDVLRGAVDGVREMDW